MRRAIGRNRGASGVLAALLAAASATAMAGDAPAERALRVEAVRPDRQAEAVLDLFRGSRAADPATAMASWRRATGDSEGPGKAVQAVLALFNPETAREWRAFHGAILSAGLDADGSPHWSIAIPRDDGTIAALIASLRLSGGSDEPPTPEGRPVRRLGGPGAAIATVTPSGIVVAGGRADLDAALAGLGPRDRAAAPDPATTSDRAAAPDPADGFHLAFLPELVPDPPPPDWVRPIAAVRGAGLRRSNGVASLRDDHLDLDLASDIDPTKAALLDVPPIDPAWLAWLPADVEAAAALSAGRGPAFWDALFDLADRVDRAEPARAGLQPLRSRLNFLALVRGVRPEVDLWPLVRGLAAGRFADGNAIAAIAAGSPEDADRILRRVVLPLAPLLGGKPTPNADPGAIVLIGRASGKPVSAVARGATVLIGWGDGAIERAIKAAETPDASIARLIATDGRPAGRVGLVRPGILPRPAPFDRASPLTATLAEAAPLVWRGGWDDGRAWDVVRWGDLRRGIARFLERIPQAPPEAP